MAASFNVFPAGYSPQKVPQFMINNVLAVCPDVNPKDVAKDLVITGSTTRTINRILDGQFPAAINVDHEDEDSPPDQILSSEAKREGDISFSRRNSTMAVINEAKSQDRDSSETEETDSDDEDETKSLFTALKGRLYDRESHKGRLEQSNTQTDFRNGTYNYYKKFDRISNKNTGSGEVKRTSSIIDVSFSDDSDDGEELCLQDKCNIVVSKCSLLSRATGEDVPDCILVEPKKVKSCGNPKKKGKDNNVDLSPRMETNIMDSHLSSDDDNDFPCMLPSSGVSSESQNSGVCQSFMSSCSSGTVNCAESHEIPTKRKKRTAEEVLRQKNNALRRKQAKMLELQAKKEAKEKEKQERELAREQMKVKRDKEKLLKKVESMNQKSNRLDGCIKQVVMCIDPNILQGSELPADNVLLQKLELLGAGHKVIAQRIPCSVTWQRANVEHDVDDTLQISSKTTFVEEQHAVLLLTAIKFVEMVSCFCKEVQSTVITITDDNESLAAFCERILEIYAGKVVTLVILGLEEYFKGVKLTQQRQFRNTVLGSSSSDTDKPSGEGRKKAKKGPEFSVMVSRVDVEEALVDLQLRQPNCRVRMCETEEEFAEMLSMFTKAVAEAPYKKKQPEAFSFCVEGGDKGSVKVSKEGNGLKRVWQQNFQQFRNVSPDMASAIVAMYPTPQSLFQAYSKCGSREEAAKLLQDILVRRGAGVLATSRRIGPELSRRIHMLFTSEDGDLSLK
ncbi:crossover junction endonuclease EME1-like isoform X2 [Montipora capricornis]|uniref:crossover junction endonuclease EME1-like isoform X2 n=1 Tax=Montipora capricornis TaxID=246305 RepID=UPI0035F1EDCC